MLKLIPKNLSPDLIKIMIEMGHGDKLLLADANYPGHSLHNNVIRADGLGISELLDSILKLFPLDTYVKHQVELMKVVEGDDITPVIWDDYKSILKKYDSNVSIDFKERFDFYEASKDCYAIVITGETALYGNIIITKGVI